VLASSGNLFDAAPGDARQEVVASILNTPDLKIERIVSSGQHNPLGFWYDQPWSEWVVLLAGSAALSFEGEAEVRILQPGDYLLIPARQKHRVEWTSQSHATIWLAVHFPVTG
jgi:cupin 2 domain-containing protein